MKPTEDDMSRSLTADLERIEAWDWTTADMDWPRAWRAAVRRAIFAEAQSADLLAACEAALPALDRAALELGGTGYFASKADEVRAAIARARGTS